MQSDNESRPATPKAMLWTGWILTALPALFMLFGAVYGLTNPTKVAEGMQHFGYPDGSLRPIIIVELICVLIYLIPQTAVLGAILLTGYLGGATATHVRVSEPFYIPVVIGIVVWLGIFLRDARLRALLPLRN